MLPGVYLTVDQLGPLNELARVWAGVLFAGPGAAASHATALRLFGVLDQLPMQIEVCVPQPRQVRSVPGLRVRRADRLEEKIHPVLLPPRTRIEVAVLDHSGTCTRPEPAMDAVLRAAQRRLTTAGRLRAELDRRPRHRWRGLLAELLADVEEGVTSALELRYARDVERAHGLPRGVRNQAEHVAAELVTSGPVVTRYRDVRYREWCTVVELDGREAHPADQEFRDHRRDNAVQARNERPPCRPEAGQATPAPAPPPAPPPHKA